MSSEMSLAPLAATGPGEPSWELPCFSARFFLFAFAFLLSLPLTFKAIYWLFLYPFWTSPLRNLPGPKDNTFFLGQSAKFLRVHWIPQLFVSWSRQWPQSPFIRYIGFLNSECLLASNIDAYRQILQTKNSFFVKPELTRQTANVVIGDGLPFAEGNVHRQRKAALMKPFSIARLRAFVPTLFSKSQRLVDALAKKRDATGKVEVESDIWKTVLDVICIEVLGTDLDHLESDESPLHDLFHKTMQQSMLSHIFHYLSSYIPLRHLFPSRMNSEFLRHCSQTRDFIRGHVTARRASVAFGKKLSVEGPDALQYMIDANPLWNDDEIVEYALNLLVLGHDTTACTVVWAVEALSRFTEYQDRLRVEIQSLLKDNKSPTNSDIDRLPLLENFLREVLRLYCPVAYIPREATSDVEIAGVVLPKGTLVHLSPAVMNMHIGIWGEDVDAFNPDRWDNLTGDAANTYAFESFHNGPRMCLGKQLSMVEMKIIIIELVSRFRVESLNGGEPVELARPTFTLRPKDKLRVKLVDVDA